MKNFNQLIERLTPKKFKFGIKQQEIIKQHGYEGLQQIYSDLNNGSKITLDDWVYLDLSWEEYEKDLEGRNIYNGNDDFGRALEAFLDYCENKKNHTLSEIMTYKHNLLEYMGKVSSKGFGKVIKYLTSDRKEGYKTIVKLYQAFSKDQQEQFKKVYPEAYKWTNTKLIADKLPELSRYDYKGTRLPFNPKS